MRVIKTTKLWLLTIALMTLCVSVSGYSQDLDQAKQLCGNLTTANRAMAKQAGYNVDEVCGGINKAATPKKAVAPAPIVARATVTTPAAKAPEKIATAVAPVAVAGIGAPKPAASLKPFGYDLFANAPTTFAPAASIPVSGDYLLGPGDTLDILFYGKTNNTFSLEINREGSVDFPELGPVGLAGLTYGEAKDMLQARIAAQIIGTQVSISMGSLRSMQIFVLGEAFKPGAYTVSSLSTITHALVSSGGVTNIGSLRNIQLKRQGKLVATLDLYDLLLLGDTSNDVRVQAADVIYIPTVGGLVSVSGQVLRPAIYELKGGEVVKDLVQLAGGMGPKAFAGSARIERIGGTGFMTALDLDLTTAESLKLAINDGDHLSIDSIINRQKASVNLTGHVYHPGIFAFREGMRVSDLVRSLDQFPPGLDVNFGIISREDPITGDLSAVPFLPSDVIATPESEGDVLLHSRDQVMFFSDKVSREAQLAVLVGALRSQARVGELAKVVSITGAARLPGNFPIASDMRISDLISVAGGLTPDYADLDYAVLVREDLADEGDVKVLGINLRAMLADTGGRDDLSLQPKDQLMLFTIKQNKEAALAGLVAKLKAQTKLAESAKVVRSGGTVRFPGEYPLVEGMSVNNLISLSGGLIESAYSQSAEIARLDLSNPNRAVSTIVLSSLSGASSEMLAPADYVEFRTVPDYRETSTISLQGEFVFPGVYAFDKGETLTSVIQRAGGFTDEAFIGGSVFLREALKIREQQELDRLARVLNDDLNADRLRDVNSEIDVNESQLALQRNAVLALTSAEALGRLVIPLSDIVNFSVEDIILKDNDRLLVPKFSQEVTVIGEVQRPTSYLYDASFSQADYLMQSGGMKPSADKRGIYVVKAGGQVIMPTRGLLRFRSAQANIGPGDTIVVPLDTDDTRIRGIPLLAEVSTIIYQLALGAAAVNSFSTP